LRVEDNDSRTTNAEKEKKIPRCRLSSSQKEQIDLAAQMREIVASNWH
jgi:hypothetical protein